MRVPDTPEVTRRPWTVSLLLVAAAAGKPVAAEMANVIPRRSAVLGWQGGREEIDEQLGDALSVVVMDPMRRAGQALDAVEVGHIVVVGLG
jgi:hypothetical protein